MTTALGAGARGGPSADGPTRIVPARRWGSWVAAAGLILVVAGFLRGRRDQRNVRWSAIGEFLFDPTVLAGVRLTLVFTIVAMVIGTAAGVSRGDAAVA